jgi:hypothetical protein
MCRTTRVFAKDQISVAKMDEDSGPGKNGFRWRIKAHRIAANAIKAAGAIA